MQLLLFSVSLVVFSWANAEECAFPFVYKGKVFTACTRYLSKTGWCALDHEYKRGRYKSCELSNKCVFPFYYHDRVITKCTKMNGRKYWCSTTEYYIGDYKYCDENDMSTTTSTTTTTTTTTTKSPMIEYNKCRGRSNSLNDHILYKESATPILAPLSGLYKIDNLFDGGSRTCYATRPSIATEGKASFKIAFKSTIFVHSVKVRTCHILWTLMYDVEIENEKGQRVGYRGGRLWRESDYTFDIGKNVESLTFIMRHVARRWAFSDMQILGSPKPCVLKPDGGDSKDNMVNINNEIRNKVSETAILAPLSGLYEIVRMFDNSVRTCYATIPSLGQASFRLEFNKKLYVHHVTIEVCHILYVLMLDADIEDEKNNRVAYRSGRMFRAGTYVFEIDRNVERLRFNLRGPVRRWAVSRLTVYGQPHEVKKEAK